MKEKLRQFMMGRYGNDHLNRFLLVVCLVLLVISCFWPDSLLWILGFLLVGLVYFRMLSRNIARRRVENAHYLRYRTAIRREWDYLYRKICDRKTYTYFRCPFCHTPLRVPKGKGRIVVKCHHCQQEFERIS